MSPEYLKKSNKAALRSFAAINVVLFWGIFVVGVDLSTIPDLWGTISVKDGLFVAVAPLATFVIDGLLTADAKARLVYWRWQSPLPGSNAFSKHLLNEPRANSEQLNQRWGPLPQAPHEQNSLWYRMYKHVETEFRVHEANRAWLLARDLTGYAVVLLPCLGVPTLVMDTPETAAPAYLAFLSLQYLLIMLAARTYGIRFVCTVLATASTISMPLPSQK